MACPTTGCVREALGARVNTARPEDENQLNATALPRPRGALTLDTMTMRTRTTLLLLVLLFGTTMRAQLSWVPCTMPVNTLTALAMGPYGELMTLLNTNPAQVRMSTDQGQTWQDHAGTGGPNGTFLSETRLHFTNDATILVWGSVNGGSSYNVWRSTDGGDTFTMLGTANGIPAGRYFMGFSSGPSGDVYLYGEGILRSTDDGQTWTSIVGANTALTAMAVTTTHIWAVQLGAVYRGNLDGTGFTAISTGAVQVTNGLGITRGMNDRIISVGGSDRVITTADGGNTWQAVNTGITTTLNNELQHIAASLGSDTWVTAKQITVFSTDNGGAPWVNASSGLGFAGNEPIQGVFCDSTGTFYLYGYFHLYRSNTTTGIGPLAASEVGAAYPNPTDGTLRLPPSFNGKACQVIDAAGREVLRVQVGHGGSVDLGALEDGRYLLRNATSVVPVQVLH